MSYVHLTLEERNQLYKLRNTDRRSIGSIAPIMSRSRSTISRELRRNVSTENGYLPDTAQETMKIRRFKAKVRFGSITPGTLEQIKQRLELSHSPEQLTGRMKVEGPQSVSHETISQMIYTDHEGLGDYKIFLRQKQKRRRRKSVQRNRGTIPDRVGIEHRPEIADLKTEIGHWESDTVIGSNHAGAVVTHVDKASKFLLAGLARNKTVEQINRVTFRLFKEVESVLCKTMTFDNGREFCGHAEISKKLGLACFFAHPYHSITLSLYHSWERGLNEHTNGLIREFFPKCTNFKLVKEEDLQRAVNLINHRPRKSLDYRTPYEVFFSLASEPVALQI